MSYATPLDMLKLNGLVESNVKDVLPHKLAGVPLKIFYGKSSEGQAPS